MNALSARRPLVAALMFAALVVFALAACSSATSAAPKVSDAWIRAPAGSDMSTAGYLTISNAGGQDDALIGVTSPGASTVEMHETSMDSAGMTGMHPVDRIAVSAGATVKLEPGGYHLMIMGLTRAMAAGDTLELDLTFEHAGKLVVQAEVKQG